MVKGLPLAVYGKPLETADAGGYRFLVRHAAFDEAEIDAALRRMVTALEWRPGDAHAPVFGVMRVGVQILTARYLDVGRDATGRPHTLRVECVLSTGMLDLEGWPDYGAGDELEISEGVKLEMPSASDGLQFRGAKDSFSV
jgi:hypothetical protein